MATTLKFVTQYGIENVGSVSISSGTAAAPGISLSSDENSGIFSPGDNILAVSTDGTERLRFSAVGAWGIAGANYGTSGQALISNGDATAPSWQTVIPAQTGNGGKYLTTDGSSASWSVIASVSTLADATVLGTSNTSISITGKTSATYADAPMTIQAGPGQYTGNTLTVSGGTGGAQGGGALVLCAGTGYYLSSGTAGTVTVHADNSTGAGGAVEMRGGDGNNGGGALTLRGGDSSYNSAVNGAVSIRGGNGSGTTTGGSVTISGGTGGTAGGALVFQTATTTTLAERMRIDAAGNLGLGLTPSAWNANGRAIELSTGALLAYPSSGSLNLANNAYFNTSGAWTYKTTAAASRYFQASGEHRWFTAASGTADTAATFTERLRISVDGAIGVGGANYGTSGQVLTSNGVGAAPSWQTVAGGSFTGGTVANATTFASSVAFGARYDELRSDVTATATTNVDCAVSNVVNVTLSASITSLTFSNVPASGRVFTLTLFLNQDATGSRTVAWPAAVKWPGAAAPTLTATASKTDIITLVTHDGGTSWFGFVAGQNF